MQRVSNSLSKRGVRSTHLCTRTERGCLDHEMRRSIQPGNGESAPSPAAESAASAPASAASASKASPTEFSRPIGESRASTASDIAVSRSASKPPASDPPDAAELGQLGVAGSSSHAVGQEVS